MLVKRDKEITTLETMWNFFTRIVEKSLFLKIQNSVQAKIKIPEIAVLAS